VGVAAIAAIAAIVVAVAALAGSATSSTTATPKKMPYVAKFPWGTFKLSSRIATKLSKHQPLNVVLSMEGTGIAILGPLYKAGFARGIALSSKTYPLKGKLIGPVSTDPPAQVAQIETLLNSNQIDCLSIEAGSVSGYTNIINKAVGMGIPTFTVGTDIAGSKRFTAYLPNHITEGKAAADIVATWAQQNNVAIGQVAMAGGDPTRDWARRASPAS